MAIAFMMKNILIATLIIFLFPALLETQAQNSDFIEESQWTVSSFTNDTVMVTLKKGMKFNKVMKTVQAYPYLENSLDNDIVRVMFFEYKTADSANPEIPKQRLFTLFVRGKLKEALTNKRKLDAELLLIINNEMKLATIDDLVNFNIGRYQVDDMIMVLLIEKSLLYTLEKELYNIKKANPNLRKQIKVIQDYLEIPKRKGRMDMWSWPH